jgi:hypothetical protein
MPSFNTNQRSGSKRFPSRAFVVHFDPFFATKSIRKKPGKPQITGYFIYLSSKKDRALRLARVLPLT